MKTEKEIRDNLTKIEESDIPLDDYMQGYTVALCWVLEEKTPSCYGYATCRDPKHPTCVRKTCPFARNCVDLANM